MAKNPHDKRREAKQLKQFQWQKGQSGNPKGRAPDLLSRLYKQMAQDELRQLLTAIVRSDAEEIELIAQNKKGTLLQFAFANAWMKAAERGDVYSLDLLLSRIIGRTPISLLPQPESLQKDTNVKSFEEFCVTAGYPKPFEKQDEMRRFIVTDDVARLLLGARGYGKTDYAVILGVAYQIYLEHMLGLPQLTVLIITKSEQRNAAMLDEIRKACEANGVVFEKTNATCLRVPKLVGKDHTVSTKTVRSSSFRGGHPKLIIMDDPVTEEDVSEATRKQVQRVYNEISKLCSNVAIIGQPVHRQDLYAKLRGLLKKMEVGHGSIPELDHDLEAMRLAGVSEESIQASYFLKIVASDFAPFDKLKYIEKFIPGDCVAFIDPSFKGGDFTAMSIVKGYFDGVMVKGKVYKKAWNHCLDELAEEMIRCGVKKVCIETNSLGDQPVLMLRQALASKGIGVIGKDSTNNKHSRIMNAGAYAHLIHLARDSDSVYIEQVEGYEYGVKNDDAPDSLASALEWIGLIRGKKV